ncbi:MAG: TonB-dependent receptor plug domain-containing protein [Opitutaceae bacterium]|nr:TonB-dependent receptor plug domain-containing protein [Opitutaceae bacterium]
MYLPKAVVAVDGTSLEVLTDDSGTYVIRNVPAGERTITVAYGAQTTISSTVVVPGGGSIEKNFAFNRPPDSADEETLVLNVYEVNENRYRNAAEIAANEERQSVNIKNVIAADAFGDIPSGNVGEFVKFIPGILVDYGAYGGSNEGVSDSDASGISVRGFGPDDTEILIDGMPVSNAFPGTLTRQVGLDMLSINNASRVEVTKVPTPDMSMNAPGGSINLITKSAFEYARPSFSWSVFATGNSENLTFGPTVGPNNQSTRKLQPAGTISMTYPFSTTFGFSITASHLPEYNHSYRAQPVWDPAPFSVPNTSTPEEAIAIMGPAYANPRLTRLQVTDTPQLTTRNSGNIKLDWRPFPGHTLSANFQASTYEAEESQRRNDFRTGTPTTWGPDFTIGQTNNGTPRVAMTVTSRDKIGDTFSGSLTYTGTFGGWDIFAAGSRSISNGEFKDRENGHFSEATAILGGGGSTAGRVQVNFRDINNGIPGTIEVLSNGGISSPLPIDYTLLSNWRNDGAIVAKSGEAFSKDTIDVFRLDVRRELDFLPWSETVPLAIKVGGRRDVKNNEKWGTGTGYAEDLKPGATLTISEFIDDHYVAQSQGFGLPAQQWLSPYKLFQLDQERDLFEAATESRLISNYNSYANQQKSIKETKDAWYAQLEGRALNNRLNFVAGLRQQRDSRKGRGPFTDNRYNYVKAQDGTVYRRPDIQTGVDNNGNPVYGYANGVRFSAANDPLFSNAGGIQQILQAEGLWYPTDPATGAPRVLNNSTLEGRMLQLRTNRPVDQSVTGDPAYSVNVSYDITKKLVGKIGWSRTMRQPRLEESGNIGGILSGTNQFTFNEFTEVDDNGYIGEIKMANPALESELSEGWDLSLSYYWDIGTKASISYYWKDVTNQQVTYRTFYPDPNFMLVMESAGLDGREYPGYYLSTSTNGTGKQKTDGIELEVQQNFGFLGRMGRRFDAFASYTQKGLGDPIISKPIPITMSDGTVVEIAPSAQRAISQTANKFASAGLRYSGPRLSIQARGTYRVENERERSSITYSHITNGTTIVNYMRVFDPSETRVDLSLDYRINERLSFFATGRDVFNSARKQYQRDDLGWRPSYAQLRDHRSFGVDVTFGLRGTF